MTPQEMAASIYTVSDEDATDYGAAALQAAKIILRYLESHPEDQNDDYWQISDKIPELCGRDLTAFQVGWALNAAKYALSLPPVPNPALFTIRLTEEE